LSRSVLDPVKKVFGSPRPTWACEFTSRHVVVAGVDSARKKVVGKIVEPLPSGAVVGSLAEKNLVDIAAIRDLTKDALRQAGHRGFEITVVIPDESSRITFITVESLAGKAHDRDAFIRWKLKKSVPFDVDTAQMAYQVLGPHEGPEGKGFDVLVALSPRAIVQEYEELLERLDIHAGYIVPSSVALMNLYPSSTAGSRADDTLFIKIASDSVATTIFQSHRPRFYRRVTDMPLYDAVYPTMMYYQDKLGGHVLSNAMLCGYDKTLTLEMDELEDKLGLSVRSMGPNNVEDIYKPALGATGLIWANSI
jgi:type IV pilus assembly protein PilM